MSAISFPSWVLEQETGSKSKLHSFFGPSCKGRGPAGHVPEHPWKGSWCSDLRSLVADSGIMPRERTRPGSLSAMSGLKERWLGG